MKSKQMNLIIFALFCFSIIFSTYQLLGEFDIVKAVYFYSGLCSLIFFASSLFFSLYKFKITKDYPKFLGFYAFFWALIHFLNYFIFTKNFNIFVFLKDTFSKNLEFSGFLAFLILTLMFISSFKFFRKLSKIRKFGYICFTITAWHYFISAKIPQLPHFLFLTIAIIFLSIKFFKVIKKKKQSTLRFL
ncbi:sulfite oxidase heme-binding subunit YedZ [Campylobacter insulaenigrae]|uniref:Sulfite oxidase heme-binding subunit YedZ n=1 Tax=Campylobacter insulaenigrae TaxID=260714 RepID=A0ABY3G3H4_9BACT|nr:ferric reductase-like transmembrane domain-containing protein [Campylobacter insulaenigrae]MCR6571447.1 sulfite oxidase heme-binding subunit YedZ [Campylobacter insulaenigrae]MCR6571617.1 sulfite oxidase heme-binding subunit YedZ [Campylobacter insulaenigrae]MCR6574587.1 sulfite oxidase heme-binding subunit YedZ [Campylobacter insulaenigrae]MCR6576156.1 sulfite oxidase heme-binding subunit YedZ [Campylobacter insulaenigrae]MCR6577243.1 sulfite oxidase heme-binding subunit YedZ [Campylobacte